MQIKLTKGEINLLKQIARKSRQIKLGHMQCLNSLAFASGYENWKNLNKEHQVPS
jgi:hypothetical protein